MAEVNNKPKSGENDIISLDKFIPLNWRIEPFCGPALNGVGLNKELLDKWAQELEEIIGIEGEFHPTRDYAPVISFINTCLGYDGRTIVEIGPRNDGIKVLKYLASKGVNAIGLDCCVPKESTDGIKFIHDRWENIESHVHCVDAIYIVYMHPDPEDGGLFECRDISDKQKIKRCKRDFEAHIAKEMAKVLKVGGIFMIEYLLCEPQFRVYNQDVFEANGFKDYVFSSNNDSSFYLHAMQKMR